MRIWFSCGLSDLRAKGAGDYQSGSRQSARGNTPSTWATARSTSGGEDALASRECLLSDGSTFTGRGGPGMLVLTRKSNQSIMIGDDIEISVLADHGREGPDRHRGAARRAGLPQRGLPRDPGRGEPGDRQERTRTPGQSAPRPTLKSPERASLAGQHGERLEHHDRDHARRSTMIDSASRTKRTVPALRAARTRRTLER